MKETNMKKSLLTIVLLLVPTSSLLMANQGEDLIANIISLLRHAMASNENLEAANAVLRDKIGKSDADKAIDEEFKKQPYAVGEKVSFVTDKGTIAGKISAITSEDVSVITSDGGSTLKIADLDARDRRRFNFDPVAFTKNMLDPEYLKTLVNDEKKDVHSPSSSPSSSSSAHSGLNAGVVTLRETSRELGYVNYGWKVTVTNNTGHDIANFSVSISFRDKEDVEIAHRIKNDNAAKQGESVVVTDSTEMKTELWQRVDHTVADLTDMTP